MSREPHPTDRWATHVTFPEHGATTVATMERDQQELGHLLFAGMPDKQFACFVAGLDEILTRLREAISHGTREDNP